MILLLVLWSRAVGWGGGRWELFWWKTHMGIRPAPTETQRQERQHATKLWHTANCETVLSFPAGNVLLHTPPHSALLNHTARLHNVILVGILLEMIIWINKFTCSNTHLSYLNKFSWSQKPPSSVWVNQGQREETREDWDAVLAGFSYHCLTSTPVATTAERPGPQTLQGYRMNLCACAYPCAGCLSV